MYVFIDVCVYSGVTMDTLLNFSVLDHNRFKDVAIGDGEVSIRIAAASLDKIDQDFVHDAWYPVAATQYPGAQLRLQLKLDLVVCEHSLASFACWNQMH